MDKNVVLVFFIKQESGEALTAEEWELMKFLDIKDFGYRANTLVVGTVFPPSIADWGNEIKKPANPSLADDPRYWATIKPEDIIQYLLKR